MFLDLVQCRRLAMRFVPSRCVFVDLDAGVGHTRRHLYKMFSHLIFKSTHGINKNVKHNIYIVTKHPDMQTTLLCVDIASHHQYTKHRITALPLRLFTHINVYYILTSRELISSF